MLRHPLTVHAYHNQPQSYDSPSFLSLYFLAQANCFFFRNFYTSNRLYVIKLNSESNVYSCYSSLTCYNGHLEFRDVTIHQTSAHIHTCTHTHTHTHTHSKLYIHIYIYLFIYLFIDNMLHYSVILHVPALHVVLSYIFLLGMCVALKQKGAAHSTVILMKSERFLYWSRSVVESL